MTDKERIIINGCDVSAKLRNLDDEAITVEITEAEFAEYQSLKNSTKN